MKSKKRIYLHNTSDITKVKVLYNCRRLQFFTSDGCEYYTEVSISCSSGVRSIHITRQWEDESALNSTVSVQEKKLQIFLDECKKSLTKNNKIILANTALKLFNKFFGNICMDDFPQGIDTELKNEETEKHNPNAGLWDFLSDVKIGEKIIKKKDIQKMLKD